jgi:hypothetical protein
MQCILCKVYFWKVFHKYYNFICAPICTKSFIFLQKVGVTRNEFLLQGVERLKALFREYEQGIFG